MEWFILVILWILACYILAYVLGAEVFFAGYDGWAGYFLDRPKAILYICLVPTLVIKWDVKPLFALYLEHWRYRHVDPEICCCGDRIGHGGSICHHGGCRSAKEYAITCDLERGL